jgi:hypothetical protein
MGMGGAWGREENLPGSSPGQNPLLIINSNFPSQTLSSPPQITEKSRHHHYW